MRGLLTRVGLSVLLAAPLAAHAELYRCTIDGKATVRDRPCPDPITQHPAPGVQQPFTGCYYVSAPGGGYSFKPFRVRLAPGSASRYALSFLDDADPTKAVTFRPATEQETRLIAGATGLRPEAALIADSPQADIRVSLTRYRNEYNDLAYLFMGPFSAGPAQPIRCP